MNRKTLAERAADYDNRTQRPYESRHITEARIASYMAGYRAAAKVYARKQRRAMLDKEPHP